MLISPGGTLSVDLQYTKYGLTVPPNANGPIPARSRLR